MVAVIQYLMYWYVVCWCVLHVVCWYVLTAACVVFLVVHIPTE